MRTSNLGILAHVDAGKTSLTERLLHATGAIDALGSVDDGSTQTDSLALERRRGITIKAAVASFAVGDLAVNVLDTPGHPDFIAEVERVLGVLDGAVLVVSAVEGVQPQTRILLRALRRMRVPTLIFVNKVDRAGANTAGVLRAIAARLTPAIVPLGAVRAEGTREAAFVPHADGDAAFTRVLAEALADHDDDLLAAYVEDEALTPRRLRRALADQTRRALVHPLVLGSARTGAGVGALLGAIAELLPAADGDADGPADGRVFKIERTPGGEKVAYVRMRSGTLRARERLADAGTVTAIEVVAPGGAVRRGAVAAGQVAKVHGLAGARVGDAIGASDPAGEERQFAPPTLEAVVVPERPADRRPLRAALLELAEQDPLIGVRRDALHDELAVSLYGEVQKEVIEATLADEYGLDVAFRATTTICVERPAGAGEAVELIGAPGNPFLATVGLRVEAGPVGGGVAFGLGVELGSMPLAFFKAVEEAVGETLRHGLHGWRVTDCRVTMTHSGYWARQSHAHGTFDKSMSSTARDFRQLTPLVLVAALRRAGSRVHEPLHRFRLEVPADALGPVLPVLGQLGGVPEAPRLRGGACLLEGELPAGRVHELRQRLPALTRGEGVLETAFAGYRAVAGPPPSRAGAEPDPRDREAYVRRVLGLR